MDWIGLVSFFSRSPPDMELLQFSRWGRLLALAVLGIISVALVARAQDRPKIEVVPQVTHSDGVRSVAFSPDGHEDFGRMCSTPLAASVASGTCFVGSVVVCD